MTTWQHVFGIVTSIATLLAILELVRRRKLREEYSWLWILTALGMVALSTWFGLIERLTHLIGAANANTTLFIFGLLFLLLISVHYSTVLSRLTQQVRRLTQEMAILTAERDEAIVRAAAGEGPARREPSHPEH